MRPGPPSDTPIRPAGDPAALDAAAGILAAGGCVAVPTETVYGLAADACDGEAVAGIYEAKGRPSFNPLIAHCDTFERADALVELGDTGTALARAFWPGPLTLVGLRKAGSGVSDLAAAGLETLAVRVPRSPALQALIARLDRPLAAPSANASGQVSPSTAAHVKDSLNGRIHLILDGGPCAVGVESAIVDVSVNPPRLLRPGGISREALETVCGPLADAGAAITAPGMLTSHYAPNATLRLDATTAEHGEAYLAFGPHPEMEGIEIFNLSPSKDLAEAAANLFAGLRVLDARANRIAAAPIPRHGLGEAINDRLARAAAGR
ncbi:MAG: L-threonylcarbamoyladenylate synthase [Oceanicaulis sp.]